MIGVYDKAEGILRIDDPVVVEIALKDPATGETIYITPERLVEKGDSITWTHEGITLGMA